MGEKSGYSPIEVVPKRKRSWRSLASIAIGAITALYLSSFVFTFEDGISEPEAKKLILNALEVNLAGEWSKKYTAEPHLAGTNYGLVEWTKEKFEEYGFDATIDTYDIYVSYPNDHDLNLLDAKTNETIYKAPLKEDEIKEDSTTLGNDTVPTFLAYAANGNVTGQFIYANYGRLEDFAKLKELGVDVEGKIAIIRYGAIFRGLKVKFAQENGAIGVLLYSDPGDDHGITPANGYKQYPHGPARQESSVQRGSVQFLGGIGSAPGDPTTPGYPSKPGAERKDPHNSIGKIPALPISYREVKPILEKLNGHGVQIESKDWQGELEGFDYSTGPSKKHTLNLYNDQIYNISTLYNVYGEIQGEKRDEVIIIGNHRDAWIKGGAGDPNSGSATLLEIARALGSLKEAGYKFKRSIILQSYDGEEYGLLGSTEQGEYFADKYKRKVVAYLNLDASTTGKYLNLGASPVLNHVLREAAKEIEYPEEGVGSLYDHFVKEKGDKIKNLGSGSDYTVFLEHLGIPSADLGFGQGKGDPVYHYHSNYDSYYWISEFADKGFVFHNLAAKYLSFIIFSLSEHELINFKLEDYANDLVKYYKETIDEVPKEWFHQEVSNQDTWDKYLRHDIQDIEFIADATNNEYVPHVRYPIPEYFTPQQCQHHQEHIMFDTHHHKNVTLKHLIHRTLKDIQKLKNTTAVFDIQSSALQTSFENKESLNFWQKIRLHFQIKHQNKLLQYFERNFLYHKGLYERPWFKHIIFASGRFTGYAGQTFPGLKEAIEDGDFERFVEWLGIVSKALRRVTAQLSLV
ncbi:uncharacterized protein RJT20DRAFT_51621 [Scheffersomyces xylosifermentans]|uniref:uncharacterized protein n=1 Tax=Scheffersomyces xylosifermentans TaxID=1304137 RepID=UPI00315CF118